MATASELVTSARGLVQDLAAPYRFADSVFLEVLNMGLADMRRLRYDLFIGVAPQTISAVDSTAVTVPATYTNVLVSFMAGRVMLRDHDPPDTERAAGLLKLFHAQLTSLGA